MTAVDYQPPRGRRLIGRAAVIALALFLLWLGGLLHFAASLPRRSEPPARVTDAIVVLTGGSDRLGVGLALLADGQAKRMFVSGVNPGTSKSDMQAVAGHPELFACCIDLGFAAADTAGNALETAAWAEEAGYRSLRVVTASYHMPRSLVELRRRLPDAELVPHPVFPSHVKLDRWWLWPGTATLLASEYQKYLAALLRARLEAAMARTAGVAP
jgi:uncharacterized SAM-binding protein YcdF (DUF218 family)